MAEFIQVFTTVDNRKTANRIAGILLAGRIAACVQVCGPINSSYRWRGKIRHAREWFCLVKARTRDYPIIEGKIKAAHPYHTPEILAVPVQRGSRDYLNWVRTETARITRQARKSS